MKKVKIITLLLLLLGLPVVVVSFIQSSGENKGTTGKNEPATEQQGRVYTNKEDNAVCLKCHSKSHIEYKAEGADKVFKQKMFSECIIDTVAFYSSNHWNFKCIDCHSDEYSIFPHKGELRFEEKPNCLDCHGGDPKYKQFHFEEIDADYQKSVHYQRQKESFNCYSCHDGHYYKLNARNRKDDILGAIEYDNNICLSCHANINKYQLITNKINPNILDKHDWLPNQPNHFKRVRCIECHGEINDSLVVAHNVRPKERAVKKCTECHSGNSRLMASLYKFQLESKGRLSFGNAGFLDEPVIIGGKRNQLIKLLGNLAFFMTLFVIIIHTFLRINGKK